MSQNPNVNMFLASNLKIIRERKNLSQEVFAEAIGLTRTSYKNYENKGVKNPPLDVLMGISSFTGISIDTLIKVDFEKLSEFELSELERGFDKFVKGEHLRVLATTIDSRNKENIELVPLKAMAGYTSGYNDPEYIGSLPAFQLPFLSPEKKYRAFQIKGDSMLPIKSGSYVIGEYVQNWNEIKDGHAYVIITENEGAVFKVVFNEIRKKKHLLLRSLNMMFAPYIVPVTEVREVWKFVNYFTSELPDPAVPMEEMLNTVLRLKEEVAQLKQ